jgi:hypothetical protein
MTASMVSLILMTSTAKNYIFSCVNFLKRANNVSANANNPALAADVEISDCFLTYCGSFHTPGMK